MNACLNIGINQKDNESKTHLLKQPTVVSIMELIYDYFFVGGGHFFSTLKKETFIKFLNQDIKYSKIKIDHQKTPKAIMKERKFVLAVQSFLENVPINNNGFFDANGNNQIDKIFLEIENVDYKQYSIFLTS